MKCLPLALAASLAAISLASAQTYRDTNGTIIPGVVPLSCPVGGGTCTGPSNGGGGVSSTVVTGQVVIAVTGTAVAFPSNVLTNGIVIKAKSTNAVSCGVVGGSGVTNVYNGSGNGYGLCPGEAASFAVDNSNLIYVNGTVGDIFTIEGN